MRLASEGTDVIAFDICAGFESVRYRPVTVEDLRDSGLDELGRIDVVVARRSSTST